MSLDKALLRLSSEVEELTVEYYNLERVVWDAQDSMREVGELLGAAELALAEYKEEQARG